MSASFLGVMSMLPIYPFFCHCMWDELDREARKKFLMHFLFLFTSVILKVEGSLAALKEQYPLGRQTSHRHLLL